MARPTKLTPELSKKLCELVAAGVDVDRAAACVGISPRTLERWRAKGAGARAGPHRDLVLALGQADAMAEVRDVLIIGKAAQTNWKAAAWRLERRFAARWGAKRAMDPPEGPTKEEVAAGYREMLRLMEESIQPPPATNTKEQARGA
ncbi:MAG TPA: hypothetical protein VEI02_03740 [Planctomycetota bacterium]|nr:hypothetical protein [Planctomycetota bacterium]